MAGHLNRATLIGNVGKDPEIRTTQGGTQVANFSMATTESWKDKSSGEKKERTEWHKIVVWGALANIVEQYVNKGSKVYIEGAIQTEKWTDKDNVERYTTKIVLQGFGCKLILLGSPGGGNSRNTTSKRDDDDEGGWDAGEDAEPSRSSGREKSHDRARGKPKATATIEDDDIPF